MDEGQAEQRRLILESGFAYYLFQHYKSWQGFSDVNRPEFKTIGAFGHYQLELFFGYLTHLLIIIDRERHEEKKPLLTAELMMPLLREAADALRKDYPKARLLVEIIEIDTQPTTPEDRLRLKSLKGQRLSLKKPIILAAHIDADSGTVFANVALPNYRWRLERLLRGAKSGRPQLLAAEEEFGALPQSTPWLTYATAVFLAAVFLWEVALSKSLMALLMLPRVSSDSLALLSNARYYGSFAHQLGTYTFLHGGLAHILTNGVLLLLAGTLVERLLGRCWCLIGFAAGAIGGGLLFIAFESPNVMLRGASGALMGLTVIGLFSLPRVPQGPTTRYYSVVLGSVFICSLIPFHQEVSYLAHFGGALGAALFAPLLLRQWRPQTLKPERSWLVEWLGSLAAFWLLYAAAVVVLVLTALT